MSYTVVILLARFSLAVWCALLAVFFAWRQDRKKRNLLETRFSPCAGPYVLPLLLVFVLP